MIRTVVCEKDGCSGNKFFVDSKEESLTLICAQCETRYDIDIDDQEFLFLPNCSSCNNDTFKAYKDLDKNSVYLKCSNCLEGPEKIYIDNDGNQISYEGKLLNDIKEMMGTIDQRMHTLEVNIKNLENNQNILEQSLAYINKYLVEKD